MEVKAAIAEAFTLSEEERQQRCAGYQSAMLHQEGHKRRSIGVCDHDEREH